MSYSRFKILQKFVNGIPQQIFIQGDLLPYSPFDSYDECNEGNSSPSVTPDNPDMLYRWVASNEPWCDGTNEYKTEKQQQSSDFGKSWSDSGATRKGEFVQSYSFTCGFVAERWIEVNQNVDFICENGNKYYLQKKQISHDGVNWNDSGDTRKGPLIESQSSDCSYPQTRWVEIPIEIDYVCVGEDKYYKEKEEITYDGIVWEDTGNTRKGRGAEVHSTDCGYVPPTVITRWITVEGEFICQGTDKYQKQKEQISNDSGKTWQDTGNTRAGSLIESDSYDCGYVSYRWVDAPNEYVCQGTDKYAKQKEEKTTDGQTWTPTGRTRTGALIEKNSYDCGYVSYRWVTVQNEYVCSGTDKYTKEKEQSSTDGQTWTDTGRERAGSLIERDSSDCQPVPPTPVSSDYLTFTALEDGTFQFGRVLYYSFDKVEWTRLLGNRPTPTVAAGSKIYFKGTMTPPSSYVAGDGFSSTGRFTASGTPMSLLFGDYFEEETSLKGKDYAFCALFGGCTKLTSIDGLSLPATILAEECYSGMFAHCTGLTSIPSTLLPATALADICYKEMFAVCTGLTSIPSDLLPAATLARGCYWNMFRGCTGLTSIPTGFLPATTLADGCYKGMFYNCQGLTSIPSDLLPATTLAEECYSVMFTYCTNITTAPNLTATTLADYCYGSMFSRCSKLNSISMMAIDISATECLKYWVSGVASSGTFYKAAGVTIPTGISGIPSGWTVVEAAPPTEITRWVTVEGEFICQGVNKYKKEKEQISEDEGQTWTDTGRERAGSIIESGSYDCGYISYEWVTDYSAYICQGTDKYQKQNEEMTSDGQVWTPTGRTRTGDLIRRNSYDCGYISSQYLTFTALEDGTFKFTKAGLFYSTDRTNWTALAANANTPTIAAGNKIYFKGRKSPSASNPYGIGKFSSTGNFTVSGTPMSLLFGDDFEGETSLKGSYAFYGLFSGCAKLTSIDDLSLPATTLTDYCYQSMFADCTGLTSIPSGLLPATTLAIYCYYAMFGNCTGLTSIPSTLLPATTLAGRCYSYMFSGCTGLTSIPSDLLPATTLVANCYYRMFQNCTSITAAPDLLADTLTSNCYAYMFYGCSSLNSIKMTATITSATNCLSNWVYGVASSGTFYKAAGVTIPTGVSGIPSGWTVVEV